MSKPWIDGVKYKTREGILFQNFKRWQMGFKIKAWSSRETRFKRTRLKFLCIADETENLSSV